MRKQQQIKYFRYADDINIMAKTQEECQRMVVYLDLLARDLSLIPQSEKIGIFHIDDIQEYIGRSTSKFSQIAHEYANNGQELKVRTHNKLKRQFLNCLRNNDYNKSTIRFALYKLNKDDEVKDEIVNSIKDLELFYDGIIYYFNRHYPHDSDFHRYIVSYLLSDTVLYQYNKALLFKDYEWLEFNEEIFSENIKEHERFWLVQYQLIKWLIRSSKYELALEFYKGSNYYIKREISYIKIKLLDDIDAKKIYLENMLKDKNPMVALHGFYLWDRYIFSQSSQLRDSNSYISRIISGNVFDYFVYCMNKSFDLKVPDAFLALVSSDQKRYFEIKRALRDFINKKDVDASSSLMSLDLVNNAIFDTISEDKGYSKGDFGACLAQLNTEFPLTYSIFNAIHNARNQKTDAHYKDKYGNVRVRIQSSEYTALLQTADISEAYNEIFSYYNNIN